MKVIYAFLFFFFPFIFFAQEYKVSGIIVDENNVPVAYANVLILQQVESEYVNFKGVSTNEEGVFLFESITQGNYQIKASFLGLKTETIDLNLFKDENFSITLKEDTEDLDEVTINIKRPTLKKEVDRLVFNVESTALSEGNMLEMLRSTPGVLVLNNTIQIKNTTPTVYINDRKVHLSDDELTQLLEGSSAQNIKSIEVITNPPAKYDAESGAVLNIVMDKNLITGYRGTLFANYTQGVFPRYNAGMSNFYKTEKINVFANYSYTQNKINRESNEDINFLDNGGDIVEKWNTKTKRNIWSKTHNLNLNLDYFINDSNTLSFSANTLFLPYFKYLTLGETQVNDNQNSAIYNFDTNNQSKDKKHNFGFDLDYIHEFSKSKLSINAHYTTYDYNRKQDVLSQYFNASEIPNSAFKTKANQNTDIITTQLDYELTLNETSSFSTGIKSSFINTESDINHFQVNSSGDVFDPELSDAFHYDEDIFAGYISYQKNWKKLQLSTGVRLEQTTIEGKSPITNEISKQDYFKWFPTFNLSYDVSENTSVYLNYKRSVERPIYQDLNPFKYFLNDNTVVTGNPNLKPAFIDHIVIGTSLNNAIYIEAYYNYGEDRFLELPIQDNEENQFIFMPTNLDRTIEYGFDFNAYFNVTKNWFVSFSTSFYNVEDKANFNTVTLQKDTWSNYSLISNDFSFLKDNSLTANFIMYYIGKNQQGFQEIDSRVASDLAIKKSIFNKKAAISLSASDLFNSQDFSITSKYLNQNNSRFFNQDNRYIKLGFSYKFGNTILKTNQRNKEREELNRLEK
ncbi:outer membrane beta-barrel family protein [Lacinutrix iliipiscaria]|uniref:Outer membrane beta-barrel family protein n=1 Tax=Lacinutrix iliipiscaria TaxID=1230532 RepID=A0ABW5WL48_9FLAO